METKNWGRVIMGLLAAGGVLGIIGFPNAPISANGATQALQREPQIQRIALVRTPDQFGGAEKQAILKEGPATDKSFDKSLASAPAAPATDLVRGVAGTISGNGPNLSLGPVAELPDKDLSFKPVAGLIGHTLDGIVPWLLG